MTAIESQPILAQLIENLRYFTLFGFHCSLFTDLESDYFELNVFYDQAYEKDLILKHSTLQCFPYKSDGVKWIKMCVKDETRA